MKIKTKNLTGAALDWAVAKCEGKTPGYEYTLGETVVMLGLDPYNPSEDWAQGGPIIEREGIAIDCVRSGWVVEAWCAALLHEDKEFDGVARAEEYGPTPLIAAMRCYVASKLGDEIEVPDNLKGE